MATHAHTTPVRRPEGAPCASGRRFLFGAITALACTPVLGVAAAPLSDAGLLRLCALHAKGGAEMKAIMATHEDDWDTVPELEARVRFLVSRGHHLAERIAHMEATTLEGFKAKARVLLYYSFAWADGSPMYSNHAELMGWSLAMNLTGGQEWEG